MARSSLWEIANMIMIEDEEGNVLVEKRLKNDRPGITFPGGHVEKDETILESVISEAYEETGYHIENPLFCGFMEWEFEEGIRYIGFLYKTKTFSGTLKASEEGEVFWIKKKDLFTYPLSQDLDKLFEILESRPYSE